MNAFSDIQVSGLISTAVYAGLGLVLFVIAYFVIEKLTPFSVRKEIEEDQNTALGLIIGLMMVGLAIIIAAAIMSPSETRAPRPAPPVPAPAADAP